MAKLILGIMYSDERLLEKIQGILTNKFGEIEDKISYDFNFTKYYDAEMGKNLKKSSSHSKTQSKKHNLQMLRSTPHY